jgi:hypothetical protein
MAKHRPVGNRLREERKAKDKDKMIEMITTAHRLYLETGGRDIDYGIAAAQRQIERCERYADHPPDGKTDVALRMLNAALRQLATFERMRIQKWGECEGKIDETMRAKEEAGEEQAELRPDSEPEKQPNLRPVPPETAEETAKEAHAETPEDTPEETPEETSEEAPEETPEESHDQTGS